MTLSLAALPPFRRFARWGLAALTALLLPGGALATTPPLAGAEVPGFVAALEDWLSDDESTALPALADLAIGGNEAARVLLGLIDKTPSLQGPYLAHMPRAARIALLRAPGGISGQSWLRRVDAPLVEAWAALHRVGTGPEVIARFQSLGEARAAREALMVLAAREHPGLRGLDPEATDPDMLYLLWRAAGAETRLAIAGLVPPGDPQRQLMGETVDARDIDRWLARAPAAAPLAALCETACPAEIPPCLSAAYRALGSHDALLSLGSPAEALIEQQRFLDSPRGRASVMRRILLGTSMRGRRAMLAQVSGGSACLGAVLSAEAERYRPALPGVTDGG